MRIPEAMVCRILMFIYYVLYPIYHVQYAIYYIPSTTFHVLFLFFRLSSKLLACGILMFVHATYHIL